ncbi:hypothetical protein [Streptomyces sp. NBC_01800]|uniref:hypothetical protein n=1 Tax=Streptomyces sp. NBC_01800 TaxID=2975945 RepID=UPI002DD97826|nr:hypothetical protein [Streptomyces sp. NBC_01800]WSA68823.1 hypothetical protein OIE65_18555 [Streptomyces sp. NBC_01800]
MTGAWTLRAPCSGQDGFAPNQDDWKTVRDLKRLLGPRLGYCKRCPYRAECIATIKPSQVMFDGIAGGRLWCNGEVIDALDDVSDDELAEPKLRPSCGTEAGAKSHSRNNERICPSCRQVTREMDERRNAEKPKQEQLPLEFAGTT